MKVSTVALRAACGRLAGCEGTPLVPEPHSAAPTTLSAASLASEAVKPNFNLEVILRGQAAGVGFAPGRSGQRTTAPPTVNLAGGGRVQRPTSTSNRRALSTPASTASR